MLHSSYNLNHLGSQTLGTDLIGGHHHNTGLYDTAGTASYAMGGYMSGSPPPSMQHPPPLSTLMPSGSVHNLYSSPLPRRRYSIGGLPSASMTEYLSIMQQNADAVQLSNLLNETKTSITRASQILSRGEDISDDIMLSTAAGDLAAQYSRLNANHLDADITAANILNQLPPSNSFSSHPNIYYSQPNYHNNQMTISSYDYLSRFKKPSSYQLYTRPTTIGHMTATNVAGANPHFLANSTYVPSYTNTNSFYPHHHQSLHQQLPPQSNYGNFNYHKYYVNQPPPPYSSLSHHRPLHYTSNPAISQSSNYYFKHNYNNYNPATTSGPQSYNNYPLSGYSNQHFDLHHYTNSNCKTKLDLVDYLKPNSEQTKRQVSFNVDVDTLSIES